MKRRVGHWRRAPDGWIERQHRGAAAIRLCGLPVVVPMTDLYHRILP
jgi:hypothetical protein